MGTARMKETFEFRQAQLLFYLTLFHLSAFGAFSVIVVETHIKKADAHAKQHDFTQAIESLLNALEVDPRCVEAYSKLGDLFFNIGKIGEAVESYSVILQIQPNAFTAQDRLNAIAHYNSGILFARRGNFEQAQAEYQLALQLCPNQSFLYYQFGHTLACQHNFSDAIAFYQKSIRLYSENTSAHYQLMNAYFRLGNQEKGNHQLKKLREVRAQKRFRMAENDLKNGSTDQAFKLYNRVLDMDPECAPAYARLGAIAFQKNELVKAHKHLQQALEIDPDLTAAHYQLSWIYQKSGQIKKAVNSLEKVVALRPNSAPACNTLAMLYLEQDYCLDDALILAKKAVKLKPIASYWDTLAYSLYKKQNYKEADEAIKKALELQPGYPEYLARQQAVRKHLTK
ncbi:hypothetical protein CMK14_01145 [Candidatus Poribacteria bacterium]|nr:hypothetical protein [Candidatus Poribacteria bacterium]